MKPFIHFFLTEHRTFASYLRIVSVCPGIIRPYRIKHFIQYDATRIKKLTRFGDLIC